MNGKTKTWEGLAEVTGLRLVVPNKAPDPKPRIAFVTLKIDTPTDDAINSITAGMGTAMVVRLAPDQ